MLLQIPESSQCHYEREVFELCAEHLGKRLS